MPAFVVTPDHYPDHEPGTAILGVDAEPQAPAHLIPQAADGEWDEETLEELAARIQEAHVAVARASAAVVAFAVTAGRLLLKARARVPVGSWGPWLECNCKFSVRTAQDYMRIARAFDERLIDPQHAADSLREVLFTLRKKRATGEEARETAADGCARTRANSTLISSPGTKSGGVSWASPNNWATSGSLMPTRSHAICSANWFARRSLIFGSIRAGRPARRIRAPMRRDNPAAAGSAAARVVPCSPSHFTRSAVRSLRAAAQREHPPMSPDEVVRLKSILEERFHGAEAALKAALNEVDLAAAFPDFAEAVCAEVGGSRPVAEAVLEHAKRRGDAWLSFRRV